MEPICANWTSWEARASIFAPQSTSRTGPFAVGIRGASGGRSIPRILPTRSCPPARVAPVLPAVTKASHVPSLTSFRPLTIEESFFVRMALTGGSAISMISRASRISSLSAGYVYFESSERMTSSCPTSVTWRLFLFSSACTAPLTGSTGARSPPIASTATLTYLSLILIHIPERHARWCEEKSANTVSLLPSRLFVALRHKQPCKKSAHRCDFSSL